MFFHNPHSLTSFFNLISRNQSMAKQKIVELHVGEETTLNNESTKIKFMSLKADELVRLGIDAPYHVRVYTEETRKKHLAKLKKEEGV